MSATRKCGKLAQQRRKNLRQQRRRPLALAPIETADKRYAAREESGIGRRFGRRLIPFLVLIAKATPLGISTILAASIFTSAHQVLPQVVANGNDFVAVDVEQRRGRVQVLPAVHGAHQRHSQAAQGEVANPAGGPRVGSAPRRCPPAAPAGECAGRCAAAAHSCGC